MGLFIIVHQKYNIKEPHTTRQILIQTEAARL